MLKLLEDETIVKHLVQTGRIELEKLQSDSFINFIKRKDFINDVLENYFNPEIENFEDFFPDDVLQRLREWIDIGEEYGYAPYEFVNPYFRKKIIASVRKTPLFQKIINFLIGETKLVINELFEIVDKKYGLLSLESTSILVNSVYSNLNEFTMDVYILSRMLKPSLSDSREVFVYAGAAHTERYADFFIYLAQDETPEIKNCTIRKFYFSRVEADRSKCIEIGKLQKIYF